MQRRKFIQNKLWRDKMVTRQEALGSILHWKILDDATYKQELRNKMLEEAHEVFAAQSQQDLIEELADLFEIMDILREAYGCTQEEICAAQEKKQAERGGFTQKVFVTVAEHLPGSPMEQYCLANPEKYPEILS